MATWYTPRLECRRSRSRSPTTTSCSSRGAPRSRRGATSARLTRRITLRIPIVSANMDTVTDARLAVALAHEGGIGVVHRFMTIEEEAVEVARVKRPEEVVVRD